MKVYYRGNLIESDKTEFSEYHLFYKEKNFTTESINKNEILKMSVSDFHYLKAKLNQYKKIILK